MSGVDSSPNPEAAQARERIAEATASLPGAVFATLFGSRADDRARSDSDWDVGVYLDDALDARERSRIRLRLVAALEPAIQVDVVILNDAPALLARRALDGERLFIRDQRTFVRFFVRTLAAAGDEAFWRDLHARERARRLAEGRFGRP
jgi:predicted nucleotidyltransferase